MSTIDQGNTSSSAFFQAWPPHYSKIEYETGLDDDGRLVVWSIPPGRFCVYVFNKSGCEVHRLISQVVSFELADGIIFPHFNFAITWNGSTGIRLFLDEIELVAQEDYEDIKILKAKLFTTHQSPSMLNTDAERACAEEVKARSKWFLDRRKNLIKKNKYNLEGRRPKAMYEQIADLGDSMKRLLFLMEQVKQGHSIWLGPLSTELRALLIKGNNYDPLLLRVANMCCLPLPVYVRMESKLSLPDPRFNVGQHKYAIGAYPSIASRGDICHLRDLEYWLDNDFIYLEGIGVRSAGWFISECAHTFGPAHYDTRASLIAEHLIKPRSDGLTILEGNLFSIAYCVLELTEWLLGEIVIDELPI